MALAIEQCFAMVRRINHACHRIVLLDGLDQFGEKKPV
jgi:hypothetical protein